MRTTLTLDDDVAQAAKSLARLTGKTLGKALSELVRRGLSAPTPTSRRRGVPRFDVGDSKEIIPADRAANLLAEEPR